jgi:hypothetical protein
VFVSLVTFDRVENTKTYEEFNRLES